LKERTMTELTGWTPEQERELRTIWQDGSLSNVEIAKKIGRNYAQLRGKLHRMGLVHQGRGKDHDVEPPSPRVFMQAASVISGIGLDDILNLDLRGRTKGKAPRVRQALICAMASHLSRREIATALGMKFSSISATKYQCQRRPGVMELAKKIEAASIGNPAPKAAEPEAPAKPRYHPGYSVVTSSGIIVRRCPDTGNILFHERDRSAFAHLIGEAS
jgi:hypothetical protein